VLGYKSGVKPPPAFAKATAWQALQGRRGDRKHSCELVSIRG